jgi:predicted permease
MIWLLRVAFSGVLLTMLCVTGWAGARVPLWQTPDAVLLHPWFIATLFDCYFAFLTFYLWVAYRESRWLARLLWLIAILLLGNIAMASYLLIALWRLPSDAPIERLLLRHRA